MPTHFLIPITRCCIKYRGDQISYSILIFFKFPYFEGFHQISSERNLYSQSASLLSFAEKNVVVESCLLNKLFRLFMRSEALYFKVTTGFSIYTCLLVTYMLRLFWIQYWIIPCFFLISYSWATGFTFRKPGMNTIVTHRDVKQSMYRLRLPYFYSAVVGKKIGQILM